MDRSEGRPQGCVFGKETWERFLFSQDTPLLDLGLELGLQLEVVLKLVT